MDELKISTAFPPESLYVVLLLCSGIFFQTAEGPGAHD